jgi:hypothetical protein
MYYSKLISFFALLGFAGVAQAQGTDYMVAIAFHPVAGTTTPVCSASETRKLIDFGRDAVREAGFPLIANDAAHWQAYEDGAEMNLQQEEGQGNNGGNRELQSASCLWCIYCGSWCYICQQYCACPNNPQNCRRRMEGMVLRGLQAGDLPAAADIIKTKTRDKSRGITCVDTNDPIVHIEAII